VADHYEALGVPRNADEDTIKRAYKSRAGKAHPDREGGSHEAMRALTVAKSVLLDPERRARYDQTGDDRQRPPLNREAISTLVDLFRQLVECAPSHVDLIELVRQNIRSNQERMRAEISQRAEKRKTLAKRRARLKFSGTGPNFIGEFMDQQIAKLNGEIESIQRNIEVGDAAHELAAAYAYTPEEEPPRPGGMMFTTSSATFNW
jgi:curved DNA-binding protein CbpA